MQMDETYTIHEVKRALNLADFDAYSAQKKMTPSSRDGRRPPNLKGRARLGGVLVLLYNKQGELHLVLTRRRDDLNSHAGQMSFPGGQHEAQETLMMTALRETEEEIGVSSTTLEVLGALTSIYIPPSDFEVYPFVAWYNYDKQPRFTPNPDEVAEIIEVPLHILLDPGTRGEEPWEFRGQSIIVPYYALQDHKVWGATAMMISELLERLREVRLKAADHDRIA